MDQIFSRQTIEEAERAAPLMENEPLPLRVPTLRHVPQPQWPQYCASRSGDFVLAYILPTDSLEIAAYQPEIGAGRLRQYADGTSPATERAEEAARRAGEEATLRYIAEAEAAAHAARLAQIEAEHAATLAALDAQLKAAADAERRTMAMGRTGRVATGRDVLGL